MNADHLSSDCECAQRELNAYVDGELRAEEQAAIERHLEACAACREELALLRLMTQSLRQAPRPEPSEAMGRRLMAQVGAELPLHHVDIVCTERHGQQVVRRREVWLYREPVETPRSEPLSDSPIHLIVQRSWRSATHRAGSYHVIESYLQEERS